MEDLLDFALEDDAELQRLRGVGGVALGLALAARGCTSEAAYVLRPLRKDWGADAEAAEAALAAAAWWAANWRDFARLKQAGKRAEALALLGGRAVLYWDQPALLLHLAGFALEDGRLDLAAHLFGRCAYLADRGVPRMEMGAFGYVARAGLVDVRMEEGDLKGARAAFDALVHNPGNAMAREMQEIRLLVREGRSDAAMGAIAAMLAVAARRKGYSADMRRDFAARARDLEGLRARKDWAAMLADPAGYGRRM